MKKTFYPLINSRLIQRALYIVFSLLLLMISANAMAADSSGVVAVDTSTLWSNTTFLILFGVIVFLLIIIWVLAGVLKDLGGLFKSKDHGNLFKTVATIIFIVSSITPASAASWSYGGITPFTFYFLISVIIFEIVIIGVLINLIYFLIRKEEKEKPAFSQPLPEKEVSLFERVNASVAIEKEEEIMFDHEYDGIRELDNDLPPWWKYGFYITVVVGFIYLGHYHITRTGPLQTEEYENELNAAEIQLAEYRAKAANLVDETNVTLLTDEASLKKGKELFENCYACHGKFGEGNTVGPNLTDDYWLYGGDVKNIFKTIKYGTEKGMKSWKDEFSPMQISQLSAYIKSLHGTNPPNAKEPQGDLYKENNTISVDSTLISSSDSLK